MMAVAISEYLEQAPSTEEDILVDGLIRKDPEVWRDFLQQYENSIFGMIVKILKNRDRALDVFQDTCLLIMRDIGKFERRSSLRTWVCKIAITAALKEIRDNKTPELMPLDDQNIEGVNGVRVQERLAVVMSVRRGIAGLPQAARTILDLDINGYSNEEIADELGCTLGTVKIRLHRAKGKLRKKLVRELNRF